MTGSAFLLRFYPQLPVACLSGLQKIPSRK